MSLPMDALNSLKNTLSAPTQAITRFLSFRSHLQENIDDQDEPAIDEARRSIRKFNGIKAGLPFLRKSIALYFNRGVSRLRARPSTEIGINKQLGDEVRVALERIAQNPILERTPERAWEGVAVFNSAAIYLDGVMHFVYRAIGENGLSTLGYAASKDGVHIDERHPDPIYPPAHFSM